MKIHSLSAAEWSKSIGIGISVAILTAVLMVIALRSGLSPLPEPLGLAFAETLFGRSPPMPVGLLFHIVWVTAFSVVYVALFRDRLSFARALGLAAALWVLVLVFFFPLVGWGFLGLSITPKLIVASAVPHLLFALFLWALCRWAFGSSIAAGTHQASR
jgi:hypothetical protein